MDKTTIFQEPKDVTYGRGYVYSLQFHIVWCTKYRKPSFCNGLDIELKEHLIKTAKSLKQDETALQRFYDTFKRCKIKG